MDHSHRYGKGAKSGQHSRFYRIFRGFVLLMLGFAAYGTQSVAATKYGPASLKVGCPWNVAVSYDSDNTGVPDINAYYWIAYLPSSAGTSDEVVIHGQFPPVRFFSFTVYDKTGVAIDYLPDASLVSDSNIAPNSNPAALPAINIGIDTFTVHVRFSDAPAQRAPNTLYVGSGENLNRQLLMRFYLPNPGVDGSSAALVPDLTYVPASGPATDFLNTTDSIVCQFIAGLQGRVSSGTLPANATSYPRFIISPEAAYDLAPYSNAAAGYANTALSQQYDDVALIRMKQPATPAALQGLGSPQARYISLCSNSAVTTEVVGCLTDKEVVTQGDGYTYFVVSTLPNRPVAAAAQYGFNWLDWGSELKSLLIVRQLLTAPGFQGSFKDAALSGQTPSQYVGDWLPETTYCDLATFNANALNGGATTYSACQKAYRQKRQNSR